MSVAGLATAGYDHRYFSVGVGGGWSMLNNDVYRLGGGGQARQAVRAGFEDVDHTGAIVQEARLGALDGMHVAIRNTFVVAERYEWICYETTGSITGTDGQSCESFESQGSEFAYGGIGVRAVLPVGDRTDLVADGGTGDAGATWMHGGVASWLRGNGDRGSLGVEVAAGYGNVWGDPGGEYVTLFGPLISVGGRGRW